MVFWFCFNTFCLNFLLSNCICFACSLMFVHEFSLFNCTCTQMYFLWLYGGFDGNTLTFWQGPRFNSLTDYLFACSNSSNCYFKAISVFSQTQRFCVFMLTVQSKIIWVVLIFVHGCLSRLEGSLILQLTSIKTWALGGTWNMHNALEFHPQRVRLSLSNTTRMLTSK